MSKLDAMLSEIEGLVNSVTKIKASDDANMPTVPVLKRRGSFFMVPIIGDIKGWKKYVHGTRWGFNRRDDEAAQAFLDRYTSAGNHIFVIVDKSAKADNETKRLPALARVAVVVRPNKDVLLFDATDRGIHFRKSAEDESAPMAEGDQFADFVAVAKKHAHGDSEEPMSAAAKCYDCGEDMRGDKCDACGCEAKPSLSAALNEVQAALASISAAKKPKHAVEKDSKGKWRIRSMKDGKLWPQTYDTKEMANKGLAAYHLRQKGVPPKKTKAAAGDCPECGAATKLDMSGKSCPDCGWAEEVKVHSSVVNALEGGGYKTKYKTDLEKLRRLVDRNYLTAEQVAGAVVEALHQAQLDIRHKKDGGGETRVSVRLAPAMAIAIGNEIQQALSQFEEDVIDVSAKAKRLAARAKPAK